ncbi:MAG: glycosyltransferase [Phycisphaerales bacterium]|nr:glycosyltransferase [Phycisphaerales bacterium]
MSASKRLLVITRSKNTTSFKQRIEPYIAPLAQRGIECDVQELKTGREGRAQLKSASNYDGVWMHRKTLKMMDARALRKNAKKVIYEFDDAIVFPANSESPDPHPVRLKLFRRMIALSDLVIVGNETLAKLGKKYGADPITVIPTGLDASKYIPKEHKVDDETDNETDDETTDETCDQTNEEETDEANIDTDKDACDETDDETYDEETSGDETYDEETCDDETYDEASIDTYETDYEDSYYDSHDEMEQIRLVWIASNITVKQLRQFTEMLDSISWQMPDVILRVIADEDLVTETLEVENIAWNPEDQARLISECDVGIAPLPDTPFAQGKCGLDVLQYMASGLPVIASPVGVNAEYVQDYDNGFLAYDDQHWADSVSQLLYDSELRATQGQAGLERIEQEFDFKILAPKVCDAIEGALKSND